MKKKSYAYSVQVLTNYCTYNKKYLHKWVHKELRRVYASSANKAMSLVYCGPNDAIGKIARVSGVSPIIQNEIGDTWTDWARV